jgi:hypothetical protein
VDDDVLIGGFIVRGPGPKRLILRAIGPSLAGAGVIGALANPMLELHDSTGAMIAANDDWQTSAQVSEIRASGLAPTNPLESAIVATLQPGNYTAIVRGANNTTGIALVECYELDSTATRLVNVSTRGRVGVGDDVLIGGVIVNGSDSKTVLVRALGPSLGTGPNPLTGVLANPVLELHDGSGNLLSSNDDWVNSPQYSAIVASGLAPSNSLESAILTTLSPGNYTAIVRGANDSMGIGLAEVYDLDPQQQVWIAVRTDGVAGSGTQADPYDGSTQAKFDAVMTAIPEYTAIHLGTGTFETHGALAWRPKNNWTISGAGMNGTVVMQTAIQTGQFQVIGGGAIAQNLVVSDLTVDCNYINLSPTIESDNKAIGAIIAVSGHLYNVRVIHAGGNRETFTLGFAQFGAGSTPPSSVLIENCRVEQNGPYVTAITTFNSQTNDNSDTTPGAGQSIIRNCYVDGAGIAYQISGYKSGLVDGCLATNCALGFYTDTLPLTNLTITHCSFSGPHSPIALEGSYAIDGVLIDGNWLQTTADSVVVGTSSATHVTIKNNQFISGGTFWQPIQTNTDPTTTDIEDNRFGPVGGVTDTSGAPLVGRFYNNRMLDGSIIPFLLDNYFPH